jgi:hypothetical protein
MDNAFKMRRQYASIEVQIKSVSLLVDEVGQLSDMEGDLDYWGLDWGGNGDQFTRSRSTDRS